MMFGDPLRDNARAERVLRTLRHWPEPRLPSLVAFGHATGLSRGARSSADVVWRVQAVLARLQRDGRLQARVIGRGGMPAGWLVRLDGEARVLRSTMVRPVMPVATVPAPLVSPWLRVACVHARG